MTAPAIGVQFCQAWPKQMQHLRPRQPGHRKRTGSAGLPLPVQPIQQSKLAKARAITLMPPPRWRSIFSGVRQAGKIPCSPKRRREAKGRLRAPSLAMTLGTNMRLFPRSYSDRSRQELGMRCSHAFKSHISCLTVKAPAHCQGRVCASYKKSRETRSRGHATRSDHQQA